MNELIKKEKTAIISWVLLCFFTITLSLLKLETNKNVSQLDMITFQFIVNNLITVLANAYIVASIRIIRGNKVVSRKPPYVESELNILGYIWRSLFISWLMLFILPFAFLVTKNTDSSIVLFYFTYVVLVPMMVLAIYGDDRLAKIKKTSYSYLVGIPQ